MERYGGHCLNGDTCYEGFCICQCAKCWEADTSSSDLFCVCDARPKRPCREHPEVRDAK